MEITDILKLSIFKGITEQDLVNILAQSNVKMRRYSKGDFIAFQGDTCKSLYLLHKGYVHATMENEEGKQLTVDKIEAPEVLAPAFLFATENRFPVNIEVIKDAKVLFIERQHVLSFLQQSPLILHNFLELISNRGAFLSHKLNEFALQGLKERILGYLQKNRVIDNQQQVSMRMGVARPSLARALAELLQEGKIKKEGKNVVLA